MRVYTNNMDKSWPSFTTYTAVNCKLSNKKYGCLRSIICHAITVVIYRVQYYLIIPI